MIVCLVILIIIGITGVKVALDIRDALYIIGDELIRYTGGENGEVRDT